MKKIIAVLLLLIMMVSLCACGNVDYTTSITRDDYVMVNYYTSTGELYQVIEFNKQTGITIIITYYWTYDSHDRQILTRTETSRINSNGELMS